jgi:ATP-binding cassette subfamily B protein AbcA/BmrA
MNRVVKSLRKSLSEKPLFQLLIVDKKGLIYFSGIIVVSGFLVFVTDLIFALALQRFLVSVGLLQDLGHTRFFGEIGASSSEALKLMSILVVRLFAIGLNNTLAGYGYARFENRVRKAISNAAFTKPTFDVGTTSHLFNEIASGCSNFIASSFLFFSRLTIAVFLFGSLFFYSWELTLVIALVSLLILPLQKIIGSSISQISSKTLVVLEDVSRQLLVGVRNFLFLSIRNVSFAEEKKIRNNLDSIMIARRRFYLLSSLRSSLPQFVGVLILVAIAASPLSLNLDNKSEIVPFLYLLLRFFNGLSDISRTTSHLRMDYPRVQDFTSWLRESGRRDFPRNQKKELSISVAPGFTLKDVEFSWGGGKEIFSFPSVDIKPGEVTLIKGRTGAGKSTLISLITGVLSPLSGEINLFVKVKSKTSKGFRELRAKVSEYQIPTAYVGPEPYLIAGSIRSNLSYGLERKVDEPEMIGALVLVGLVEELDRSRILDQQISEMGLGLSTGQRQKIAWARAIITRPKLLVLDEATSNLDSRSKEKVLNWVKMSKGKITTIMVDHHYKLDDLVDSTVVLDMVGKSSK